MTFAQQRKIKFRDFDFEQNKIRYFDLDTYNDLGLGEVALSKNLKLTTILDRAITQNPCYVPFLFKQYGS